MKISFDTALFQSDNDRSQPETKNLLLSYYLGDSVWAFATMGNLYLISMMLNSTKMIAKKYSAILVTGTITNQFSLAGYLGFANYQDILPKVAEDKFERLQTIISI